MVKRRSFRKRIITVLLVPIVGLLGGCLGDLKYTGNAASKDFGNVLVGTSVSRAFTWKNEGAGPSKIIGAKIRGQDRDSFAAGALSAEVPKDGTTPAAAVSFAPTSVGQKRATVKLSADGKKEDVDVTGTGVAQIASGDISIIGGNVTAGQVLDFGDVRVGATSAPLRFTIRNASTNTYTVTVSWGNGGQGFAVSAPVGNITVPPGGVIVLLTFTPASAGEFVDAVTFTVAGGAHVAGTSVKGKGVTGE